MPGLLGSTFVLQIGLLAIHLQRNQLTQLYAAVNPQVSFLGL